MTLVLFIARVPQVLLPHQPTIHDEKSLPDPDQDDDVARTW